MAQRVVLSLGAGSCQTGFQTVTAQLWQGTETIPVKFSGGLPPVVELEQLYQRWQLLYQALYERLNWRRLQARGVEEVPNEAAFDLENCIEFDSEPGLNRVSAAEFQEVCQQLGEQLNRWLQSPEFVKIDQRLRMRLDAQQPLQVLIETNDLLLRRLPWHLWNLLDACPQAYVALSAQDYERAETVPSTPRKNLRILAILGHSEGIDIQQDRQMLEQLPHAEVVFLTEPQRSEVDHWLWHPEGWDILFFAGHSSSQQLQGELYLNPTETLSIEQLRNALRAAIRRGLHLAIFNSCDGLGLARALEGLQLPQLIVMREPVPDFVAQTFLRHCLQCFSAGEPFFSAVRQAQERLQGLEGEFPCASWLPTLCQNPLATSLTWPVEPESAPTMATTSNQTGAKNAPLPSQTAGAMATGTAATGAAATGAASQAEAPSSRSHWSWRSLGLTFAMALGIAGLVIGIRAGGGLRSLELWAYDRLMLLQPDEEPDDRLLLVEVNEEDLRQYGWPLSDHVLVQLLKKLNQSEPRAIGIDIFRDLPQEPGHEKLKRFWQENQNAIAICRHSDVDQPGVPPPQNLSPEQVGFNDVVLDRDDAIRRQLWAMGATTRSECTTQLSFGLQLALRYLKAEGVEGGRNEDGSIRLGQLRVSQLPAHAGGYRDLGGYQTMLRYRRHKGSADAMIQRVCIKDVLEGRVNEALVRDRVVLLGITATSIQDSFQTPYGDKMRGVMVHAQMVSQILSTVLDGRRLITVWPLAGELGWVGVWSLAGGVVGLVGRSPRQHQLGIGAGLLVLTGASFGLLQMGFWVPLAPAGASLLLSSAAGKFLRQVTE